MEVKLISVSQPVDTEMTAEDLMVYTARVSSPQNQENLSTGEKLLRYCIKNGHWSVFAMADMTVEIVTSRAISAQILRHKSFDFQEFSQRYAEATSIEEYEARRQDTKNRQNSLDDLDQETKDWFLKVQRDHAKDSLRLYDTALELGIAKECARFLLPMATQTKLYMKGSVRSWIHYFQVRRAPSTQKEHRDVADAVWPLFEYTFPTVAKAADAIHEANRPDSA